MWIFRFDSFCHFTQTAHMCLWCFNCVKFLGYLCPTCWYLIVISVSSHIVLLFIKHNFTLVMYAKCNNSNSACTDTWQGSMYRIYFFFGWYFLLFVLSECDMLIHPSHYICSILAHRAKAAGLFVVPPWHKCNFDHQNGILGNVNTCYTAYLSFGPQFGKYILVEIWSTSQH